jgi:hypothetical protein
LLFTSLPNTSVGGRTEMTATLQEQAQQTITDSVLKHTQALCEVLTQNYIDYSIRSHQRSIERGENVEYHQQRIDELKAGKCDYSYIIESGRKYHKIIMMIDNGPDRSPSRSVHAFVDKNTGSVLKSASWKAPAKGERYNLLIIKDREYLLKNAGWSGSYLYAK